MTDARWFSMAAWNAPAADRDSPRASAMSSSPRSATPVCLVIRWPRDLAASSGPAQLLRRLIEDHLPATWCVESIEQANTLGTVIHLVEGALLVPKINAATASDAIADGLHRLSAGGHEVATLCVNGDLPRGQIERQLAQQGVRAIVTESTASDSGAVRPLPFGIWQLAPQGTLPSQRRWFRRVGGVPQDFFNSATGPTIASLDLAAIGSPDSRAWREMEKAIDQAATASDQGQIRIATVADLTAELARQSAPKPQRSILRAA